MKKALPQIILQLLLIVLFTSIARADFILQLGSFKYKQNAQKLINRLIENNFNAFIYIQKGQIPARGPWYKVRVGPFATKDDALKQRETLQSNGFGDDIVVVRTSAEKAANPRAIDRKKDDPAVPPSKPAQVRHNTHSEKATAPVQTRPDTLSKKPNNPGYKNVTLKWDASEDPDLAGYKIYYDTDPGPPYDPDKADYADEGPPPIIVGPDVTEITLHGLTGTKDYFFTITAFNTRRDLESDYSVEVAALSKPLPKEVFPGAPKPKVLPPEPAQIRPATQFKEELPILAPVSSTEAVEKLTRISPGDILDIEVPGQDQMTKIYDVDPTGNIYMVIVGKINVEGLDEAGLNEKLTKKLKKYILKGDKISTKLLEQRRYIYIQGGVRYPGWYRVTPITKLDDLIEISGGMLPGADYTRIRLKRETVDGYKEIGVRGKITLHPNDILVVPFPKKYRETVDKGDLLFVTIPQRQPPGRVPSTTDVVDLTRALGQNQIEVDRNGYLYLPDYGHIYANNMTPDEIKKAIIGRLPQYLALLGKVEVSIIEKKHYVQVVGHVSDPGWHNIPEKANLQAALYAAGQATDGAVMSDIFIQRQMRGTIRKLRVNLYQFTITGDPRLLTPIHENDIVFTPISASFGAIKRTLRSWEPPTERLEEEELIKKKVRIFGAVHNPGIYEPYEDMDLLDLMVLASGETDDADLSKVLIIRNNKVERQFNLHAFLKWQDTEGSLDIPKIYNGDTVYVRYLEWKTAEPKEDKVFYVTGKIRRPGQYKLWDQMTVLQAIALAGGLAEWADEERMTIVRVVAGKQENIPFNYKKGVSGKFPELNIYLQTDDTIVVP